MQFVGREREIQTLGAALSGALAGRGALFVLTGEPGIGKTRLCDALARTGSDRGAAVAWGAAWDGGDAPAFWPWIQVVRALRPLLPAPDEHLRRDLGPLWDERREVEPETREADLQRFRRFDALRALLSLSAARARLVVILEDMHALVLASPLRSSPLGRCDMWRRQQTAGEGRGLRPITGLRPAGRRVELMPRWGRALKGMVRRRPDHCASAENMTAGAQTGRPERSPRWSGLGLGGASLGLALESPATWTRFGSFLAE
jgi:hypothetical protein